MFCGEGHMARDQRKPQIRTHEDLRSQSNSLLGDDPANSRAGKLGRRSFPGEPGGDDSIVRDPEREGSVKYHLYF